MLCDIAPLGIAAARQAGVPSVLLENFTWDWLYEGYVEEYPQLRPVISLLRDLYSQADYHLQAVPLCRPGPCDLRVGPVSRPIRLSRAEIRRRLGVEEGRSVVLLSLVGIGLGGLRVRLPRDKTFYLVAGQGGSVVAQANVRRLAPDIGLEHQELVAACDAVIGKVGYSTLAEVYRARIPFGYLRRPGFRESGPLVAFIRKEMAGQEIGEDDLADGGLAAVIPELLARRPPPRRLPDGAEQCAEFLAALCRQHGARGQAGGDGC